MDLDIERLIEICEAAGEVYGVVAYPQKTGSQVPSHAFVVGLRQVPIDHGWALTIEDAAFIAAAREHFPELLRRWKRVRELLVGVYNVDCAGCLGSIVGDVTLGEDEMEELRELLDLPAEGK